MATPLSPEEVDALLTYPKAGTPGLKLVEASLALEDALGRLVFTAEEAIRAMIAFGDLARRSLPNLPLDGP